MFRYIFDIFCKDTTIGLCQIDKRSSLFSPKIPAPKQNTYKNSTYPFRSDFFIDQTAYRL